MRIESALQKLYLNRGRMDQKRHPAAKTAIGSRRSCLLCVKPNHRMWRSTSKRCIIDTSFRAVKMTHFSHKLMRRYSRLETFGSEGGGRQSNNRRGDYKPDENDASRQRTEEVRDVRHGRLLQPGMQYAIEVLQRQLDEMRGRLASMQAAGPGSPVGATPKKKGGNKYGWAGMTAEERSAEMRRRMANRKRTGWEGMSAGERKAEMKRRLQGRKAKAPVTDRRSVDHPEHDQLVDSMRKARKKAWKKKSPEQREAWIAAMKAGKAKADRQRRRADRAAATQPLLTMEKSA